MVNYGNKFIFANVLYHKLLVCGAGEVSNLALQSVKVILKSTIKSGSVRIG